ncbi:hypothetical protein V492_01576 [Pseudogymnoascus sp. VKM F-4246]|nr:hypothetical protein V492_01576 [Pseudogymnoascus sp. VKM F-4246]
MGFLCENVTGVPFPTLYAFEGPESERATEAGAMYMLIEGFYGNTLQDVQFNICDLPNPALEHIITQWTSIQAELATFSFPRIGSISHFSKDTGVTIEKLSIAAAEGFSDEGPFWESRSYFSTIAEARLREALEDEVDGNSIFKILGPYVFQDIVNNSTIFKVIGNGPFHFNHMDMGTQNILVDEDFNFLAILDWEFAQSAPWEVNHYPMPFSLAFSETKIQKIVGDPDNIAHDNVRRQVVARNLYVQKFANAERALERRGRTLPETIVGVLDGAASRIYALSEKIGVFEFTIDTYLLGINHYIMATLQVYLLTVLAQLAASTTVRSSTPPLGWNSYNAYNCNPTEDVMKQNAQGLVSSGLSKLGYTYVTTDCGWASSSRDQQGRLQWDTSKFPSGGGTELGDFMHGLGLKFGVYSGGGYYQCGSTDIPASLGYETIDAESFASWGGDFLKYDNCYSVSPTNMVDYKSPGAISSDRFDTMAQALNDTGRDFLYEICQWGCGTNLGIWAAADATMWRISNDISNNWASIWRITNQVVPFYKYTSPGRYPDMDMLIVGLNVLSAEEEKFHFGMWAINKSPLTLGFKVSSVPASSMQIVSNQEVLSINQDSLGKQAEIIRRYTEEEWDVWAGELSGSRKVVGLANWRNSPQSVSIDLSHILGISSAKARDVWAAADLGTLSGTYNTTLAAHELKLLVLSDIVKSTATPQSKGYYAASSAAISGAAQHIPCSSTQCLPSKAKIGNIGLGSDAAAATFSSVSATTAGKKLLGVDFINYEAALDSAWTDGTNTRNMTISVNGGAAKRWAFPISGGDWYDTGRMLIEVDGFQAGGNNQVVFRAFGTTTWAPDLVGFEVFE